MLGVTPEQVFETLEVYIGSAYVNDFNLLGRRFRVTAQAELPGRSCPDRSGPPLHPRSSDRAGSREPRGVLRA